MYNFTVIIPHKNTPDLLQRCLDSIPQRNDLQVIIVDDNSDKSAVDFDAFPGLNRENTEIVFSKGKKGKGPGFARNVGLAKAKGEWIIFSDADDYFTTSFNDLLEQYKQAQEEIIFFKCSRQNENEAVYDYALINDAIDTAIKTGNSDNIVYGIPCPWGKFIKRDFIEKNKICYQEITGGDDILFSVQMAVKLKDYAFSEERIYCVVDRQGSLTRNTQWKGFYSYSKACCDAYVLMLPVGRKEMAVIWLSSWWGFLWAENKWIAISLVPYIIRKLKIADAVQAIRKGIKRGAWNWRNENK